MSTKELNQSTKSYKSDGTPITPYLLAKQEWDNRIGSARFQAANWRICALGLLILCVMLTYGFINASSKSKITPYIVRIGQDGAPSAVGPATEMHVPQDQEIKYFLGQFIQKTRSLPLDPIVAKQNWLAAYDFLSQSGVQKMNALVQKSNPFEKLGVETKQVSITVVVPLSKNSYQVRWQEDKYASQGTLQESYKMTGIFTIDFVEPKTEEEVMRNPLGLFIKDFSWSKEL